MSRGGAGGSYSLMSGIGGSDSLAPCVGGPCPHAFRVIVVRDSALRSPGIYFHCLNAFKVIVLRALTSLSSEIPLLSPGI